MCEDLNGAIHGVSLDDGLGGVGKLVGRTAVKIETGTGRNGAAQAVTGALGLPASRLELGSGSGLTLVIGDGWPSCSTSPVHSAAGVQPGSDA
ncbi:hypothetical protein [Streptomyces sp. MMG1121]|uniref:hypothetical protein n=1 Tax=Streptomyces sp. MMG1121 TaxID=1415544 RepID=UPI0006B01486|nr:hypothetical protein [Streptomyces sp. MMG1121]KOV60549.1 hypothetical protein ADK64_30810 [Streptomyces sp. MMG1121]